MSNTSYSSKENSYNMKVIQGGEQKVMKKILSVALSTAMAFSMFASVAFGADATPTTPQDKFDALKTAGIVNGLPDGQSHLEKTLTRAELAKIVTKSLGLKEVTGVATYKDPNYTPSHWAAPFIEAVTAAKIMQGSTVNGKQFFNPNGLVTAQELAIVLTNALKLEIPTEINNSASSWAQGQVQAALNAGFLTDVTNWTTNATRSQAIVAAYSVWEAAQIPTVASYVVKDATHVDFTLSTGEVVKAELKTALVANTETPVEFQDAAGQTIATKVTWVVTSATKVDSVTATNLKQITVTFDGEVDADSAENVANYKINKDIKSAALSSDNKTVVLTLTGEYYTTGSSGGQLDNQKEIKLTVSGVKNSDKSKTITQDVTFTPVDVTTPSVKEVTGLGTKALKVVFSEPVDRATAISTANYKIDGKAIAGSVEYAFPDTVIISTALATGEHKLTASNVQDFSGLKVVPVENALTVAEDTEAPTVVSVKTVDLSKVVVEFNEPVKSVGTVYNGVSSKTGTVTHDTASNVVTVTFGTGSILSVNENTIVFNNVTDYTGNTANREVKVTPTLDTTRPEVASVTSNFTGGNTVLKVKYSEAVNATAKAGTNYTVKDTNGKVVVGKGLDANGHPVTPIVTDADDDNTVDITFAGALTQGTYTLDIAGVQDTAYVANTILPASVSFTVGDNSEFKVTKFWTDSQIPGANGKRDVYFYVTFSKPVATSGVGDATSIAKYSIAWNGTDQEALPSDSYVDLLTPETVRITVPYTNKALSSAPTLKVSLIADQDGNLAYGDTGYIIPSPFAVTPITIAATKAVATDDQTIQVTFNDKLTSVDPSDFQVTSTATSAVYGLTLDGYSYDGGNTIATFSIDSSNHLGAAPNAKFGIKSGVTTPSTQNTFGGKVVIPTALSLEDNVAPSSVDVVKDTVPFTVTAGAGTGQYVAHVLFDEPVAVVVGTNLVNVAATGYSVSGVSYAIGATNELLINFTTNNSAGVPAALTANSVISVSLDPANASAKVVTDTSADKNAANDFTRNALFSVVSR